MTLAASTSQPSQASQVVSTLFRGSELSHLAGADSSVVGVEMSERRVKVDADVAYESGLCSDCKPTKPSPWSVGALWWMQVAFFTLVIVIVLLMITAIYLCNSYVNKHGCCSKVRNRRKVRHH